MLMYLAIKIPHLQIAHQGGNLEVGNVKIHLTKLNIIQPKLLDDANIGLCEFVN